MDYLLLDEVLDRVELLTRLAERRGRTAAQLALAWVLSRSGVAATVVGVSSVDQLRQNVQAGDHDLSPATAQLIDTLFAGCVQTDPAATG